MHNSLEKVFEYQFCFSEILYMSYKTTIFIAIYFKKLSEL